MTAFFTKRLGNHQKKMMRFLKYVMNDHFVLVCMIALGGMGYYYSSYLKTLDTSVSYMRILVLVIWLLAISIGKLSTLIQEADGVFLLPKEPEMLPYLKKGLQHSLIIPIVSEAIIIGVSFPLLVATTQIEFSSYIWFLLSAVTLKYSHLWIQLESLYLDTKKVVYWQDFIWFVGAILSFSLGLYVSPYLSLISAVIFGVVLVLVAKKNVQNSQLDWDKSIISEQQRLKRIYSFFNLFTDVPGIATQVKRRRYMDGVLNRIKKETANTYLYLYSRVLVRSSEYSGLIIRLTLVGLILIWFSQSFWLMIIVGVLFIYLIGFQMLPMYHAFDYMLMTQLYPVDTSQKRQAVNSLIRWVLVSVVTLFSIATLIVFPDKKAAAEIVIAYVVMTLFMTYIYLPNRLKKIEKK